MGVLKEVGLCNKKRYDKVGAMMALIQIKKHPKNKQRHEQRFYYCSECNAYHLTSWRKDK